MRTAARALLFDWGGTLMVDFPQYAGPMASWPEVAPLPYARETLQALYTDWIICLATNAADSDETQIWAALERAGLRPWIDHVFCYRTLGVKKPDLAYYQAVLDRLGLEPDAAVMVGDDFASDVGGALQAGLRAVWFQPRADETHPGPGYTTIHDLAALPEVLTGQF